MKWVYLLLLLTAFSISVGEVSQVGTIEVACTNPEGCLGQIEKVITTAPAGSIISVGPGSYYEKTIFIDKDLTIQGAGIHVTRVIKTEPGAAFGIRGTGQFIVKMQSLSISVSRSTSSGTLGTGILWIQDSQSQKSSQKLLLKNIEISGTRGVILDVGQGELIMEDSTILGVDTSLLVMPEGDVKIRLENNTIIGALRPGDNPSLVGFPGPAIMIRVNYNIPTAGVTAQIQRNTIMYWNTGIILGSGHNLGFSKTEATLVENTLAFNQGSAVYLVGDPTTEMIGNKIHGNDYGLMLSLPPCLPIMAQDPIAFTGVIKGSGNEINQNTKGNVCPDNYPLPPGFMK